MDKKQTQQLIITGILIIFLIFAWGNAIKRIKKRSVDKKALKKAARSEVIKSKFSLSTPQLTVSKEVIPIDKDENFEWGRDPFSGKFYGGGGEGAGLELTGILWDEGNPQVIINGNIVSVGDKIGLYEVIKIAEDKVTLNNGTKDFELKL